MAVLVASILPPPAPYKVFVLTAGVLRVNAVHFGLALLVGRGLRFAAEAWLGARYGVQAQDYLRHNLGWASLAAVMLIVGLALLQAMAGRGNGTRDSGLGVSADLGLGLGASLMRRFRSNRCLTGERSASGPDFS